MRAGRAVTLYPDLYHRPRAAWTETGPGSKQSTHMFTANLSPQSWPFETKWKTYHAVAAGSQQSLKP